MTPEEMLDEWLDEIVPVYEIGEMTFDPSQIVKNCDPSAYRILLSEREEELV